MHRRVQTICVSSLGLAVVLFKAVCAFVMSAGIHQSLHVAFIFLTNARVSYYIVHRLGLSDTNAHSFLLCNNVRLVSTDLSVTVVAYIVQFFVGLSTRTAFRDSLYDSNFLPIVRLHLLCIFLLLVINLLALHREFYGQFPVIAC